MAGTGSAHVTGLELAGEVLRCGSEVTRARPGDRVMAMCGGAHAQQACVDERLLVPVPEGMDFTTAASLPVAFMTAHDALVTQGGLREGACVLVQAASSAVGIAAVQIANALGARVVVGTSTSEAKHARLRPLGLRHVLAGGPDLEAQVRELTGGHGADIVVDHLGAPALAANMACAAIGGRIVSVGRMGGLRGEIDLDLLSFKRLALVGVTFRTRTADDVAALIARMQADLGPRLAGGTLGMPIDRVLPLAQVADAHAWMRERQQFGKVVLVP
jgi:NADPH2:quinone reductase